MSAIVGLAAVAAALGAMGSGASLIGSRQDIRRAPNTVRATGNINESKLLDNTSPYIVYRIVDDFRKVVETYERTGYAVEQDFSFNISDEATIDVLFSECELDNRYYFNPVQATFANIIVRGLSVPQSVKDNIALRFGNGLRFWNVEQDDVELGNFAYDNVERSAIK